MATSAVVPSITSSLTPCMDRHDAARALLGCVIPADLAEDNDKERHKTYADVVKEPTPTWANALLSLREVQPGTSMNGLDALAVLASSAVSMDRDDCDDEPLTPRRRMRSVSNPEGMEKWDALSRRNRADGNNSLPVKKRIGPGEDELGEGPDELLHRARARLLEDLNECGREDLPHTLAKYREIYNKNGRIGIYTPSERAAMLTKFSEKRTRRVWNKKIRYNCRKNLADRRLRVKGRFVKRSSEEAAEALASVANATTLTTVMEERDVVPDLDVNDPEAGFDPKEGQPYRRARRYTIT